MATASAEAIATPWTKASPMSRRPSSAMITVMPANITARPLVSIDGDDRVLDARAAFEVLSVAGDDEQRVVDADAEADHRHHRGGEVGHRDDVAGERHERRGDAETEQGDADRQAHGEHRTEREDEDDDRGDEAVDLALGELELGEQVAAVLDLEPLDRVELVALLDDVVADLVEFGERRGCRRCRSGRTRSCRPG